MMKIIYYFTILGLFFSISNLSGQCTVSVLWNQQDIDDFSINYPGCTEVIGDLKIIEEVDGNIVNLDGLFQLTSVTGDLQVRSNSSLTSLEGLNNISSTESFWIGDNPNLESLTGLIGLNSCSYISVSGNMSLMDLSGLGNITSEVEGINIGFNESLMTLKGLGGITTLSIIGEGLFIRGNASLGSLFGLGGLVNIGYLEIDNNLLLENIIDLGNLESASYFLIKSNPTLENLEGLDNLVSIDGFTIKENNHLYNINGIENIDANGLNYFSINNNPDLEICDVTSVCNAILIPTVNSNIYNNKDGCNSVPEVELDCQNIPECTSMIFPANGATDVPINTSISWNEDVNAIGYKLNIGITPGGNEILNMFDVGNVTLFDPEDFLCGSLIYVLVVPYTEDTEGIACTEESFFTEFVVAQGEENYSICSGDSVQLIVSGGTTYAWTPSEGLNNPNVQNPIAFPSVTTSYYVSISYEGRCFEVFEVEVVIEDTIIINISSTNETGYQSNNGTAICEPTGGVEPYTYLWSTGGTEQSVSGLVPGVYNIVVTSALGCSVVESFEISSFACSNFVLLSDVENIDCYGVCNGSIAITNINNGTPPYSYLWSNNQDTSFINHLCPGQYFVTVTDSLNCTLLDTFVIEQPEELVFNFSSTDETSYQGNDGTISVSPTGGVPTYSFIWSNGDTTQMIMGLSPDVYVITVLDANSCALVDTIAIDSFVCNSFELFSTYFSPICPEEEFGFIIIDSVINASLPLSYSWNNGANLNYVDSLTAGMYIVTISDANSCILIDTMVINEYEDIIISLDSLSDITSMEGGHIDININTSDVNYLWMGPNGFTSNNQDIIGLQEMGFYSLYVVDTLSGCSKDTMFFIDDLSSVRILEENLVLNVAPNPVHDMCILSFEKPLEHRSKIIIYNNIGQEVKTVFLTKGLQFKDVDMTEFIQGVYIVRESRGRFTTQKIVKFK